jgi:hypothetical protein
MPLDTRSPLRASCLVQGLGQHTSAYVSISQHTSAYVVAAGHALTFASFLPVAAFQTTTSKHRLLRQHSHFCTSKASKLSTSFVEGLRQRAVCVSICTFVLVQQVIEYLRFRGRP